MVKITEAAADGPLCVDVCFLFLQPSDKSQAQYVSSLLIQ